MREQTRRQERRDVAICCTLSAACCVNVVCCVATACTWSRNGSRSNCTGHTCARRQHSHRSASSSPPAADVRAVRGEQRVCVCVCVCVYAQWSGPPPGRAVRTRSARAAKVRVRSSSMQARKGMRAKWHRPAASGMSFRGPPRVPATINACSTNCIDLRRPT